MLFVCIRCGEISKQDSATYTCYKCNSITCKYCLEKLSDFNKQLCCFFKLGRKLGVGPPTNERKVKA